ncbi:hypothetical protein TGPRC2_264175 [Toxoplasma gondii TgCatPRC2]|uniref:Uncharacterized protein n=3 Tax=Toxoplasma gondii TaxID=5811 RepID=A0A151HN40_TOXGO|nr:hypothetical protein TGME49_264175 [Toxoplasma gondii ME49]EPT29808.1 hypothetical protein TGME49_264175 [Toxoplasma gondii ME49]KYF40868.1 hypothetical protein TGARI_264175 [Toxoplasma gondii ARI]KYK70776.1 hypothetical protein TGPRC2_264175 [Toxoplasma gondii TgCatPRC2]|eukprot:XP_018637192.1 hypothetical protein TGME49_264175 [Toxoplasma gondii ME49]
MMHQTQDCSGHEGEKNRLSGADGKKGGAAEEPRPSGLGRARVAAAKEAERENGSQQREAHAINNRANRAKILARFSRQTYERAPAKSVRGNPAGMLTANECMCHGNPHSCPTVRVRHFHGFALRKRTSYLHRRHP